MLNLRLNGFSVETLGIIFNCDHTSVGDQCRKYGIVPVVSVYPQVVKKRKVFDLKRQMAIILPQLPVPGEERINRGKTYAEYVAEAAARKQPEGVMALKMMSSYPHTWAYKIK